MLDSLFISLGLINNSPQLPIPTISPAPILQEKSIAPVVSARAALAIDLNSGKILFTKNADKKLPIASLTKLMSAIIAQENFAPTEIVTISAQAAKQPPSKIWLQQGEKITVKNLLAGLLIESGNDVAFALAEHAGGVEIFVDKMNAKAAILGLKNTHFQNPIGFDDSENYSTAREIALLAEYFWQKEELRKIVGKKYLLVHSANGKIAHPLVSTNQLFNSFLNIRGLKTGSTKEAGECFAGVARINNYEILAIVLDSPNRFQEVKEILNWTKNNLL
jgi:serine-type D-Ala-D-Ala carboxypeptidase (penicillin-binding protein 5/6)